MILHDGTGIDGVGHSVAGDALKDGEHAGEVLTRVGEGDGVRRWKDCTGGIACARVGSTASIGMILICSTCARSGAHVAIPIAISIVRIALRQRRRSQLPAAAVAVQARLALGLELPLSAAPFAAGNTRAGTWHRGRRI